MIMPLFCLKCHARYSIPLWAMRHMTYTEYSYCDRCYLEKMDRKRGRFARLMTRKRGSQ